MIRTISGTITYQEKNGVIVEVGGIGYGVAIPTRYHIVIGKIAKYFVYQHIREDTLALYGFATHEELDLFEQLLLVPSIGPKSALAILSSADAPNIVEAIINDNVTFFQAISGVGKKSAVKIIIELKNKISNQKEFVIPVQNDDLIKALRSLGFETSDIQSTLRTLPKNLSKLEDQVTWALQQMGK